MNEYKLTITLKSDALFGSGEGYGAVIDADIVFDDFGLPIIPAKRIKGCLREAAEDICAIFDNAKIADFFSDLSKSFDRMTKSSSYKLIDNVFGQPGQSSPTPVVFSDLTLPDYSDIRQALTYYRSQYPGLFSTQSILDTFTSIRQQTTINEITGTVDKHSLRTFRTLNKEEVFVGNIRVFNDSQDITRLLSLACLQLRRIGTSRTRGLGEIACRLESNQSDLTSLSLKILEEACLN